MPTPCFAGQVQVNRKNDRIKAGVEVSTIGFKCRSLAESYPNEEYRRETTSLRLSIDEKLLNKSIDRSGRLLNCIINLVGP